jgi:predicted enzyme related to lactoylglutathione lyase
MIKPGQFCWNELATSNLTLAKNFYHRVFDWEFREVDAGTMTYTIVTSKETDIAGIWQIPNEMQGQIPPHWMSYILVDDLKKSLESAIHHGAKEIKEITQVGEMGKLAVIADPTGAYVALWETAKE